MCFSLTELSDDRRPGRRNDRGFGAPKTWVCCFVLLAEWGVLGPQQPQSCFGGEPSRTLEISVEVLTKWKKIPFLDLKGPLFQEPTPFCSAAQKASGVKALLGFACFFACLLSYLEPVCLLNLFSARLPTFLAFLAFLAFLSFSFPFAFSVSLSVFLSLSFPPSFLPSFLPFFLPSHISCDTGAKHWLCFIINADDFPMTIVTVSE